MNAYTFPDHIPISESAKDIIVKILNNDPAKRPTLEELLGHEFINHGGSIPRLLPASTLACPPSKTYVSQFYGVDKLEPPSPKGDKDKPGWSAPGGPRADGDNNNPTDRPVSAPEKVWVKGPDVWVKKWVDYSSKYGLGYLLSNRATGVFFNDSTKIVLDPGGHHFDYYEWRASDKKDIGKEYRLTDYPKDLQKKVTLLQHFWSYLDTNEKPANAEENKEEGKELEPNFTEANNGEEKKAESQERVIENVIYVKKWMRTRHAIMFRLSNKIV